MNLTLMSVRSEHTMPYLYDTSLSLFEGVGKLPFGGRRIECDVIRSTCDVVTVQTGMPAARGESKRT